MPRTPTVVSLSGNPRPGSRTATLARQVAAAVSARIGGEHVVEIDLANPAANAEQLRTWLTDADVAVIASPTYKATYTGLLKTFLDGFRAGSLASVLALPVMVAGDRAHALAVDVHLRPLLLELGAVCPTSGLFVEEAALASAESVIEPWLASNGWTLEALLAARSAEAVAA